MRIVHTSDWHAGRVWRGLDRLPELTRVLDHVARFVESERVDLVLVSGDLFDSGAPSPEAERVVFEFFRRIGRAGAHSVVIAGNHDQPARLEAWGLLAELVNVHSVGRPRRADQGGVIEIVGRAGERALVAALPFAPVKSLLSALELAGDETLARQTYAESVARLVAHLSAQFRADVVNLMVAHTHLDGAHFSGSERTVHLGEEWAATPQALPANAHYVALGHIHRPQRVIAAPAPTYYAGSPLQLDFGEAGEEKSFVLIEARPGAPARTENVPYEGGTALAKVRGSLAELERDAAELVHAGHLRVTVPLTTPDPELSRKVRAILPNAIAVELEVAERPEEVVEVRPAAGAAADQLYMSFHEREYGAPASEALVTAFRALHAEIESD
jgi:exonuclease SbcD